MDVQNQNLTVATKLDYQRIPNSTGVLMQHRINDCTVTCFNRLDPKTNQVVSTKIDEIVNAAKGKIVMNKERYGEP